MRNVFKMYDLEGPLTYLQKDPPSKTEFKEIVLTKVTVFHEEELRKLAAENRKMEYMNVYLTGSGGKLTLRWQTL